MKKLLTLLAVLMLAGFGCGENVSDEGPELDDNPGKEDGIIRPLGTFRFEDADATQLALLVLKSDMTFHLERNGVRCMDYCGMDGTYKFTKSTTTTNRYIRLTDQDGNLSGRYAYEYQDMELKLRDTGFESATFFSMTLALDQAWCNTVADCEVQDLPSPRCMCTLSCEDRICVWNEGGIPEPTAPVCDQIGTENEGWYDSNNQLICKASCDGAQINCDAVGTRSEGWYTEDGKGCMGGGLVQWDECG